jgi:hypothetical protein
MRNGRNLVVGRLICVVGLVGLLSVGRAEAGKAQDNGPNQKPPPGDGLSLCLDRLVTCERNLGACEVGKAQDDRLNQDRRPEGLSQCLDRLVTCQTDLGACEAETVVFPGDGYPPTPQDLAVGIDHGPALRYKDHPDGTFTDKNTGLQWEMKDAADGVPDFSNPHDVDNTYSWTDPAVGTDRDPDGTLFTDFLTKLNTPPCFANHCDWRVPNIKELQSIVDYSKFDPPTSVPGATVASDYWSSTSYANLPLGAWNVPFNSGAVLILSKSNDGVHARAVRGARDRSLVTVPHGTYSGTR